MNILMLKQVYIFKVADAEGDGWGNAQFSLLCNMENV